MTIQGYLKLVTSEFSQQPKFNAMIAADIAPLVQVQNLMSSMIPLFDLDTPPVGNQEDILGKWIGVSRNVSIPATGIYFSWDDVDSDGWEYGSWSPTGEPTTITSLPDDSYLSLLRLTIASNNWDGTIEGIYRIWDSIFPVIRILIIDHQDMSYAIALVGGIIDTLTLALITNGYLTLRPEGVKITEVFVSVDTGKAFGWDVESEFLGGWDEASWLNEIAL